MATGPAPASSPDSSAVCSSSARPSASCGAARLDRTAGRHSPPRKEPSVSTTVSPREELDERVAALFASDPEALADPFSIYEDVRAAARVYDHRGLVVLLTHHEDVKTVIRDGDR